MFMVTVVQCELHEIKPCLHVRSAFASTLMSASSFVLSQWLMQRMGLGPILCLCVCVTIRSIQNFDVDANADVTCKQNLSKRACCIFLKARVNSL